jgi:hypothetical protein
MTVSRSSPCERVGIQVLLPPLRHAPVPGTESLHSGAGSGEDAAASEPVSHVRDRLALLKERGVPVVPLANESPTPVFTDRPLDQFEAILAGTLEYLLMGHGSMVARRYDAD